MYYLCLGDVYLKTNKGYSLKTSVKRYTCHNKHFNLEKATAISNLEAHKLIAKYFDNNVLEWKVKDETFRKLPNFSKYPDAETISKLPWHNNDKRVYNEKIFKVWSNGSVYYAILNHKSKKLLLYSTVSEFNIYKPQGIAKLHFAAPIWNVTKDTYE